jgi:3-hydroxybutyryl-CoA dehydrogenase
LPLSLAIIGAGPLGRWLAAAAARAGCVVWLEDVMPLNLRHAQEELRLQLSPQALPAITFVSTIEDAVRDVDLVIDCVPDELESKLEIFWLLDRMAPPRTVFASHMLRVSITDMANCTYRPDRCIAIAAEASALATNPGSTVLLHTAPQTSETTAALLREFWLKLGFVPHFAPDPNSAPS